MEISSLRVALQPLLVVALPALLASTASAQGWAVFATGGNVYRCHADGSPERLYEGGVKYAAWSAQGKYVYFQKTDGSLWRMNNDGTDPDQFFSGASSDWPPIAPYRPDAEFVLYLNGKRFFRVHGVTGAATELFSESANRSYVGEIAIDNAGARIAARDTASDLYRISGGSSDRYAITCSSSISPNGDYLTANVNGHEQLTIHRWDESVYKTLDVPSGHEWDNQRFAVNSDDWIVYRLDNGVSAVGIVRVSDNQTRVFGNLGTDYPDFFVGALPDPDPSNAYPSAEIASPADGNEYTAGATVTFSGSGTDPEDGALTGVALTWALDRHGDGLGPVHETTGANGAYTFANDVNETTDYTLQLTAQDSAGLSDTDEILLHVTPLAGNEPPSITSTTASPSPAPVGDVVRFGCVVSDPDGDDLQISWTFGDGDSATGTAVEHVYRAAGRYAVEVEVGDGQGHVVSRSLAVEVYDPDLIVIEAEEMVLSGYEDEVDIIATYSTGTASATFPGVDGDYRVAVVIVKESDGQPVVDVYLAEELVRSIVYPLGASQRDPEAVDVGVHHIAHGAEVRLEGVRVDGAAARLDRVELRPIIAPDDAGARDVGPPDVVSPTDAAPREVDWPTDSAPSVDAMHNDAAPLDAGEVADVAPATDAAHPDRNPSPDVPLLDRGPSPDTPRLDGGASDLALADTGAVAARPETDDSVVGDGCGCRKGRSTAAPRMVLIGLLVWIAGRGRVRRSR